MKKFLCLIAAAVLCLSLAACAVDSQPEEKNFGMEFAEAYAKLDLNELSKLISAEVSLEPFREIMEFDRSLKALGTLTLIPVNSVAV